MVRTPTIDKNGIRRGAWSKEEDNILTSFVLKYGHSNWRQLPRFAGLARCGKSCRLRWNNYLKPDLKRGNFTQEELDKILTLRKVHGGNKWSLIASELKGRTDNEIKNIWHTLLKKHQRQSPQSVVSTHENSQNSDQMMANVSIEKLSISMSTSQYVPMNGTESTPADSIPEVSSIGNSDPMDSIPKDFEGINLQEAFLVKSTCFDSFPEVSSTDSFPEAFFGGVWQHPFLSSTSNDQIARSIGSYSEHTNYFKPFLLDTSDNQYLAHNSAINYTGVIDSFPEIPSTDTFHEFAIGGIQHESFLFSTSNDQITHSIGTDSAQTICFEPFLLDTSCSQYLAYNSTLNDESVAKTLEYTIGSTNIQNYESDCCSWTQPLSTDASSAECRAPSMPFETSDADLLKLLSVVRTFLDSDEDQNNIETLF